jgi:uroporphyrin-III C-methyltransferase
VVAGRRCLVVGGGKVAARKVDQLVARGADVTVVAPEVTTALAARDDIVIERRPYRAGEAASYRLVLTATGVREVEQQVFDDAEAAGVWVNAADDPARCSFTLPAVVRRGPVTVAVATDGTSPALATWLRDRLADALPPDVEALAAEVARQRDAVHGDGRSTEELAWHEVIGALARRGGVEQLAPAPDGRAPAVSVHLVGAGPGDPELLTVRAARLLAEADVVVHDRLAELASTLARPGAELVDVGKRPGNPYPQENINALLVQLARQGLSVVRLKGGDPFVFGRGGEEAMALAAAGVSFSVVPGVTSAVSVPAAAGVPVTHRGVAAAFTVVTGHRMTGAEAVDWDALARVGGTIVVLMGVAHRAAMADQLMAGGLSPDTPVAAIHNGTHRDQEVTRCRLAELGATPLSAPCTIVIGAVAALDVTGSPSPPSASLRLAPTR